MIKEVITKLPWDLIRENAQKHGLNPYTIAGVVLAESYADPYAIRYEPGWIYFYKLELCAHRARTTISTERTGQQISWGLMQVMGAVAREQGYKGGFPGLCDPELNLKIGCTHLQKFLSKYGNISDAVASYNAGQPVKLDSGEYKNQSYVNRVMGFHSELVRYGS